MSNQIEDDEMFQTHPCGVEVALSDTEVKDLASFRRTLVGLKFDSPPPAKSVSAPFQTHPCGVEVMAGSPSRKEQTRFRRTLVGLKCNRRPRNHDISTSFRRTLVGLK